jgi:ABC-2 type transport system permease protein
LISAAWKSRRDDGNQPVAGQLGASGGLTNATGFLQSMMFSTLRLLLMVIFAVTFAGRSATQEENGVLDLLLAQPVSRTSLITRWCWPPWSPSPSPDR